MIFDPKTNRKIPQHSIKFHDSIGGSETTLHIFQCLKRIKDSTRRRNKEEAKEIVNHSPNSGNFGRKNEGDEDPQDRKEREEIATRFPHFQMRFEKIGIRLGAPKAGDLRLWAFFTCPKEKRATNNGPYKTSPIPGASPGPGEYGSRIVKARTW